LESYLRKKVDLLRVLKLVAIHDLGEFFKGDVPAFKKKQRDSQIEEKAVRNISKLLAPKIKKELISLWIEYEAKKTPEAIFVKMLDVLDVLNQHLIANISTWSPIEMEFNLDRQQEKFFIKEPEILDIYNEINKALVLKVGCYQKNRKRNRIK
ncbi:MAG: HD domain-containing protein, partial [Spirochaetia bacterium]